MAGLHRRAILLSALTCIALICYPLVWPQRPVPVDLPHAYQGRYPAYGLNETLGFQRIFVLNLPRRPDRRDVMTLMARASGLLVDFFTARSGKEMTDHRLPPMQLLPYIKRIHDELTAGQVGCYRSNLDIMRHIVHNNIRSALILQDDAEWDVNLRQSLSLLQDPLSKLIHATADQYDTPPSRRDPWSTDQWDILWIGASHEWPWPDPSSAPFVRFTDPNVANEHFAEEGGMELNAAYELDRTVEGHRRQRIVQVSRRPLGMAAYAVTFAGAAKILARTASLPFYQTYDNTICAMSRPYTLEGYEGLSCEIARPIRPLGESELRSYSVWPPLVSQFRTPDGLRDSDLVEMRLPSFSSDGVPGYAHEIADGVRQRILDNKWDW